MGLDVDRMIWLVILKSESERWQLRRAFAIRTGSEATSLIESLTSEQPGFVPLVANLEVVWVLSSSDGLNRAQVVDALDLLLRSKKSSWTVLTWCCRRSDGSPSVVPTLPTA